MTGIKELVYNRTIMEACPLKKEHDFRYLLKSEHLYPYRQRSKDSTAEC